MSLRSYERDEPFVTFGKLKGGGVEAKKRGYPRLTLLWGPPVTLAIQAFERLIGNIRSYRTMTAPPPCAPQGPRKSGSNFELRGEIPAKWRHLGTKFGYRKKWLVELYRWCKLREKNCSIDEVLRSRTMLANGPYASVLKH